MIPYATAEEARISSRVLYAVLFLSVLLSLWRITHAPSENAIKKLAQRMRASWHSGDVVVVVPDSVVFLRQELGDLPIIEWPGHGGDIDIEGFSRVHLVEINTPMASFLTPPFGDLSALKAVEGASYEGHGLHWQLFDVPTSGTLLFDLATEVYNLDVTVTYPNAAPQACTRRANNRITCPRDPGWNYVGKEIHMIDGQPRTCVWLHPVQKGGTLRVDLPAHLIKSGENTGRLRFNGGYGFTAHGAQRAQAPVHTRLLAQSGGWDVWNAQAPVDPTWHTFNFEFDANTLKARGQLSLQIESENNGAAHFCMALRLLQP